MLTIPHCKESLSQAYVMAVVGRSLNLLQLGGGHDYGVDADIHKLTKRGSRITRGPFSFSVQLKSTTNWTIEKDHIVYDLEVDNYNDLADRSIQQRGCPFFLVLLCLDHDDQKWLAASDSVLELKQCAYYYQVKGPLSKNSATRRIKIPKGNLFDPDAVNSLLDGIEAGTLQP